MADVAAAKKKSTEIPGRFRSWRRARKWSSERVLTWWRATRESRGQFLRLCGLYRRSPVRV